MSNRVLVYGVDNGCEYSDHRMLRFFSTPAAAMKWVAEMHRKQVEQAVDVMGEDPEDAAREVGANKYRISAWPLDEDDTPDDFSDLLWPDQNYLEGESDAK